MIDFSLKVWQRNCRMGVVVVVVPNVLVHTDHNR